MSSWTALGCALLVASATVASVWWLEAAIPAPGQDVERARLRVEAIRTGLSIGAGLAAALALALAFRRQQVAERTQQATEYDAGEKRVTELYVKAAEQLGSAKAPVRLAGLYALERLAQDNPAHRQSIFEVFCAYLRMPYAPPTDNATQPSPPPGGEAAEATLDPREERQVRLTAQRILARHLRPIADIGHGRNPAYWGPLGLDLDEANLVDIDMSRCDLTRASFHRATFHGLAFFEGATGNNVLFEDAEFLGPAHFNACELRAVAGFEAARFRAAAYFNGTAFERAAFKHTIFDHDAVFNKARFHRAEFNATTFHDRAEFNNVTFDMADFSAATFEKGANFAGARFNVTARFDATTFRAHCAMEGATASGSMPRTTIWPPGWRVGSGTPADHTILRLVPVPSAEPTAHQL